VWINCGRQVSLRVKKKIQRGNINDKFFRVIDVGSEWRTFSNEKASVDPSRVGGPENPLLSGGDLSTMIGPGTGSASFDAFGSKLTRS
jgi:hypothetical protein